MALGSVGLSQFAGDTGMTGGEQDRWGAARLHGLPPNLSKVERPALFVALAVLLFGACAPAYADSERLYFWGFAGVEQNDVLSDDASPTRFAELVPGYVLEGALRYRNNYAPLQSIRLETNVRAKEFFDRDDFSNVRIRTRVEWRTWFSSERQTEFRLRGEYEYKWRDEDFLFNRWRWQAELRHRLDPENLVFARGQISLRDYTSARSIGRDHLMYIGEVGHEWMPYRDRTRVRSRIGFELANADADRHDYEGYYIDIHARHPIRPDTEVFARGRAHWREYGGPFKLPDPTEREDERYRLTAGAEHWLTDNISLVGEAGWEANRANVDERRYDGFVFRVGVEIEFDIWRSED